jgi:hypothetical protein
MDADQADQAVTLERYAGPWAPDDPDANFKALVAEYSQLDPLETLTGMSAALGIPAGAIARAVLARWAADGSAALLELGPSMVERLYEPIAAAEQADDDGARLRAYEQLRQMLSWLRSGA